MGVSEGRPEDDFYPTPPEATLALLEKEKFTGSIWEPACGDGAISKVLEVNGFKVFSSDLYNRGYGTPGVNFLHISPKKSDDNIITNPPYKYAQEFVEQALIHAKKKVAMLLKIQFLEGAKRHEMFQCTPLKNVYVFSKRLTLTRNGIKMKNSGMITYAWFVWEHGYEGEPMIDWILL